MQFFGFQSVGAHSARVGTLCDVVILKINLNLRGLSSSHYFQDRKPSGGLSMEAAVAKRLEIPLAERSNSDRRKRGINNDKYHMSWNLINLELGDNR